MKTQFSVNRLAFEPIKPIGRDATKWYQTRAAQWIGKGISMLAASAFVGYVFFKWLN